MCARHVGSVTVKIDYDTAWAVGKIAMDWRIVGINGLAFRP